MARNDPQINLRIPESLKAALDEAAEESKRSLTAEVVARLEASFSKPPSAWSSAFPMAAAGAAGLAKAQALAIEVDEAKAERDRTSALLLNLDTQRLTLESQLMSADTHLVLVQNDIDKAEAASNSRAMANLLRRRQEVQVHAVALKSQIAAIKAAIKKLQTHDRLRPKED